MEIIRTPRDRDFSFASKLETLHTKVRGCCASVELLEKVCNVLKEEYLLDVEYLAKGKFSLYFLVPENTSDIKVGWISEVLDYHRPEGTELFIVRSDEDKDALTDYLYVRGSIEEDLKELLTEQGKIPCTDEGFKLIKDVIENTRTRLVEEGKWMPVLPIKAYEIEINWR